MKTTNTTSRRALLAGLAIAATSAPVLAETMTEGLELKPGALPDPDVCAGAAASDRVRSTDPDKRLRLLGKRLRWRIEQHMPLNLEVHRLYNQVNAEVNRRLGPTPPDTMQEMRTRTKVFDEVSAEIGYYRAYEFCNASDEAIQAVIDEINARPAHGVAGLAAKALGVCYTNHVHYVRAPDTADFLRLLMEMGGVPTAGAVEWLLSGGSDEADEMEAEGVA